MSDETFWRRILKRFFPSRPRPAAELPDDRRQRLAQVAARLVAQTEAEELPCEEVFALVDEYAELVQRGANAAHLMPLVQRHLELCRDCREEYEALIRVLRGLEG